LSEYSIPATFYVPGDSAQKYPEAVERLIEAGHEIAHHGHLHLRSNRIDPAAQRAEIEMGLEALAAVGAPRPAGYRSPAWELTPETFALLDEYGFAYDSSLMEDDRPYLAKHNSYSILELPIHWSLDDWPYFGWSVDSGGSLADPEIVSRIWVSELRSAVEENRLATYTMHPEIIGRPYRLTALKCLISSAQDANVWFATHSQITERVRQHLHPEGTEAKSGS
jgi:peptidoglycan/xylan/chitin deacetylase (PgdA/CDA1 family)